MQYIAYAGSHCFNNQLGLIMISLVGYLSRHTHNKSVTETWSFLIMWISQAPSHRCLNADTERDFEKGVSTKHANTDAQDQE